MAIKIVINEPIDGLTDQTDRLSYTQSGGFSLMKNQRGTANIPFQIEAADSYEAHVGSPIFIYDPDTDVAFAGTIDAVDRKWIGDDGVHIDTLTCVSLEQCFDTIRIKYPVSYQSDMTAGEIFTDLYNRFGTGAPVTLGNVEDGATVASQTNPYVPSPGARLSDIFDELVTLCVDSEFIWGVQMSDQTLYFQAQSTTPAPYDLDRYLYESGDYNQRRNDFRDRQLIQIAFNAFSTSNEMFAGDDSATNISLFDLVERVTSAMITTSTQATVTGTLSGLPVDGDTFTIARPGVSEEPYTFVDTLDNTKRNQVLISTVDETDQIRNICHALWSTPIHAGVLFSLPTWQNDQCTGDFPADGDLSFTARVKQPGSGGNVVTFASTGTAFSWSTPTAVDGTDGVNNALNVGVLGQSNTGVDVAYVRGSNIIYLSAPNPGGSFLSVSYYRLGGDIITVENSALIAERAAVEDGTGQYDQIITDANNTDAINGYTKAVRALQQYATLPKQFSFSVDSAQLSPGQLLTISITSPDGAPALLDGVWLVQEVQANLIPGMDALPSPQGHFRYTVTVIDVPNISTFIDFFENFVYVTPPQTQQSQTGLAATATPTLKTPSTDGTPSAGSSAATMTAGQQTVQEQLGLATKATGNDLTVDASDDTIVTSASFTFEAGNVDDIVRVISGSGWTPGDYIITSVAAGAATLDSSPAATSTGGGVWKLVNAKLFQFSWQPTKSSYTGNQIALVHKLVTDGGTPPSFVTHKLTPFRYAEIGYAIDSLDADLGGDYVINGYTITFLVTPEAGDIIITEYWPSGPKHVAVEPPPPSGGAFAIAGLSDTTDTVIETTDDFSSFEVATITSGAIESRCIISDGTDLFVALCENGDSSQSALVSTDRGVTWSANTLPATFEYVCIALGSGVIVAIDFAFGHVILSSDGGSSWSTVATLGSIDNGWRDVCFGGGLFIAVGGNSGLTGNVIFHSSDGTSWTAATAAVLYWGGVCYSSDLGLYVAVGGPGQPGGGQTDKPSSVATSPDGSTWTPGVTAGGTDIGWFGVAWGAGLFVAVSGDSSHDGTMTSPDGFTWTFHSVTGMNNCNRIRFLNGKFIVCRGNDSDNTTIFISSDGLSWESRDTNALKTAYDVAFCGT